MYERETISLVIPVYNIGEEISELVKNLDAFVAGEPAINEIILVDDCSNAANKHILVSIKPQLSPLYRFIENKSNLGQEKATAEGIKHAAGDLIVTLDDDLEYPPARISDLLEAYYESGADVVYGIPEKNKGIFYRDVPRNIFYMTNKLLGYPVFSPFRLFRASLKDELLRNSHKTIFCFDKILMREAKNVVRITVKNRPSYNSRYTFSKLVKKVVYFHLYR